MKLSLSLFAAAALAVLNSGCAVTHGEVNAKATAVKKEIEDEVQRQLPKTQAARNPLYKRIPGVYIGTRSTAIVNNAALPPSINELGFQLPRRVNLATAAKNIQKLTRYPVRVNPDVYTRSAKATEASTTSPAPEQSEANQAMASNTMSAVLADGDTSLPTDFDGPLKDYLEIISAQLGINWEFDPNKGFHFYRFVTKVLEVKLHAGDNFANTDLRKGAQASTGSRSSSGGATGAGGETGSFTSSSSYRSNTYYAPWGSLEAAIKAVAPNSAVAVDISSNSIVVRGTRDEVDEAERIVQRANQVHNRMITLTLRIMKVRYSDSSSAGANFQAAYNRLMAGGGSDFQLGFISPGSLVGSDAGGFNYKIVNPQSRWAGTEGLVQAISELGTIVSDETESYPVMNRRTIPVTSFQTDTYLAETTPASGGVLGSSGSGIPGLKPGTITTGFFLAMTPTAYDDGTVWLDMSLDKSERNGAFGTASAGSGDTFQQIQLPSLTGTTKQPTVAIKAGETLMLVNSNRDSYSHTRKGGLLGVSGAGEKTREAEIILVTPHVRTL